MRHNILQLKISKETSRKGVNNMDMLKPLESKETISSLELCEVINKFREELEGKKDLKHYDLLKIIRSEFEEEIRDGKISESFQTVEMPNGGARKQPMFELSFNQAKQVLLREHKSVRKAVIKYIETLENKVTGLTNQLSEETKVLIDILEAEDKLSQALSIRKYKEIVERPLLETIEEQEEVIEHQKPKVDFHDIINNIDDTVSIGEFAILLSNDLNIIVGQNQLFEWFRENGYIKKKSKKDYNMPMGRYVKSGHLKLKEIVIQGTIYLQTRITGKGETYFTDKIIEQGAFGVRKIVDN